MTPGHEEPSAKRRRLADGHNAAQQHLISYLDIENVTSAYAPASLSSSLYSAPPNPSIGHAPNSEHQHIAREMSLPNTIQTQPMFNRSFGNTQLWERAPYIHEQSVWGQLPYLMPAHVPLHGHVWHSPAAIPPMPHHFYSQGAFPSPVQNCHHSLVETTTSYATASISHPGSPLSGQTVESVPTDGNVGLSPETASSSLDEIVCFGRV